MGLALYDSTSDLAQLGEFRHLPPGRARELPSFHLSKGKAYNWALRYEAAQIRDHIKHPKPRPFHVAALASHPRTLPAEGLSRKSTAGSRRAWTDDDREGRDLARSTVRLPSDGGRQRPPSLERQEAFRGAKTSGEHQTHMHEVDDVELYRLGLLYDNEHERGSGFGLHTIAHDEPTYAVNFRPAKRGRRRKRHGERSHNLPLHLSFAALSDDEALARFLRSPGSEELYAADGDVDACASGPQGTSLTVIYELEDAADSSSVSHLSSTSERQPQPHSLEQQHQLLIPDLVSDFSDNDNSEDGDWAILRDMDDDNMEEDVNEVEPGADADAGSAASTDWMTENPDAWIVLG